jgi:DNA-binding transcriptional ArsR family regulator
VQTTKKIIESFPSYAISSSGKVYRDREGRLSPLNPAVKSGHPVVTLTRHGVLGLETCVVKVERIVALMFLSQKNPTTERKLIHKNGDREDCSVDNLRWGTLEEAQKIHRRKGKPRGRSGPRPKDFTETFQRILDMLAENDGLGNYLSAGEITKRLSVSRSTVHRWLAELAAEKYIRAIDSDTAGMPRNMYGREAIYYRCLDREYFRNEPEPVDPEMEERLRQIAARIQTA